MKKAIRQSRFSKGLRAVWDLMNGTRAELKRQNEDETWEATRRDQQERDDLVYEQLQERQKFQAKIKYARDTQRYDRKTLDKQISAVLSLDRKRMLQELNLQDTFEREQDRLNEKGCSQETSFYGLKRNAFEPKLR